MTVSNPEVVDDGIEIETYFPYKSIHTSYQFSLYNTRNTMDCPTRFHHLRYIDTITINPFIFEHFDCFDTALLNDYIVWPQSNEIHCHFIDSFRSRR